MLARDVKALRAQINKVMPDVNMKVDAVKASGDVVEGIDLPIGVSFFWPDAGV
jgi:Flp pilus assembly secretin CpaC